MGDVGSTRVFGHAGGGSGIVTIGLRRRPLRDLYHSLVTGSWTRLIVVYALVYFATEALFGASRLLLVARPTAGEPLLPALLAALEAPPLPAGPLTVRGVAAGVLAASSGFVHWVELVIAAGIVLAKFSLVRARVLFSDVAVVAPHAGGSALMFRMANERTSHIVDAKVAVMLVRNELVGGEPVRRAHDLALAREGSALFTFAWTAIHPITRESPLHGETADSLETAEAELVVSLSGFDEALTKTMYARHVYAAERIRWNARLVDVVRLLPDGRRAVDYRKFHRTEPVESPPAERTPARRAR
jgi:inward rectifier potassium channel